MIPRDFYRSPDPPEDEDDEPRNARDPDEEPDDYDDWLPDDVHVYPIRGGE